MARIPDEVVAQLKAEVSLQRLIETAGITLKRHGANWSGLFPSTMTMPLRWWSRLRRTYGIAWARAKPAARSSTG